MALLFSISRMFSASSTSVVGVCASSKKSTPMRFMRRASARPPFRSPLQPRKKFFIVVSSPIVRQSCISIIEPWRAAGQGRSGGISPVLRLFFINGDGKVQKESSRIKRFNCFTSVPGGTRTPGLLVRSQALYPAELQAHALTTKSIIAHAARKVNAKYDN